MKHKTEDYKISAVKYYLQENVFGKYKDNLIVLDNVGSHRNEYVNKQY